MVDIQANQLGAHRNQIDLARVETILAALEGRSRHPGDLDGAVSEIGAPAFLVNPALLGVFDLSPIGLGNLLHLPIQISNREGGRKSLYYLKAGERVLAGLLFSSEAVSLRFVTRETGTTLPAQAGDRFSEEIRSSNGEILGVLSGKLEVLDAARGRGRVVFDQINGAGQQPSVPPPPVCEWWAWSFYAKCGQLSIG